MPYTDRSLPTGSSVPQDLPEPSAEGFADSSFTGRVVRPKTSRTGMVAQVFGDNGPEADLITALNLSQFHKAKVAITMAFLKNAEGRLLKDAEGAYPRKSFEAIILRPVAGTNGMVAQFFAENGKHADTVTELCLTQYVDAMVFVNIKHLGSASTPTTLSDEALNEAATRLTPTEAKRLKQEQKKASMAWNQLIMSGFFRKPEVLRALGTTDDFERWVASQPCCHPGDAPCPNRNVHPFLVPDPSQRYRHIPLCNEHAQLWQTGTVQLPHNTSPLTFMMGELGRLIPQWAQIRLRERLNTPAGHDPTPSIIYHLAIDLKIANQLPGGFHAFFEQA